MEIKEKYTMSDNAKLEVENFFRTNYLNSADVFHRLCDAQEEILLVQQQQENIINVDSVVEVLGLYKGLVEACLVDD